MDQETRTMVSDYQPIRRLLPIVNQETRTTVSDYQHIGRMLSTISQDECERSRDNWRIAITQIAPLCGDGA